MTSVEGVVVVTPSGPICGRHRKTFENIPFVSFHGIPYAKPPIGELRFKAPRPVDPWTEILDATDRSSCAPQLSFPGFEYDTLSNEDCLQLNVYTPSVAPAAVLRPVMVWIHGGGFVLGSTDEVIYGPDFLLRKEVVLVTIAYRLGPLGFLSVADPKYGIPGNAGLKDQAMGLRWVQANIDRFGGDPNNVTLFGESAGSFSVHYHLLSDHSKGLFHRAIMQSGTAFSPFAYQTDKNANYLLATKLGWNGEGGLDAMMDVILKADTKDITQAQMLSDEVDLMIGTNVWFKPCAEPYGDTPSAFMTQPINQLAKTAWGNSVPLMIGCNSDEGVMFASLIPRALSALSSIFSRLTPRKSNLEPEGQPNIEHGNAIQKVYYGSKVPSRKNLDIFAKLQGDRLFWHGTIGFIRNRLQCPDSASTYLYRFSFDSKNPAFKNGAFVAGFKSRPGCVHAEELMYLFRQYGVYQNLELSADSVEASVISRFVDIWTTFASSGNPNCVETKGLDWKPVAANDSPFKCLHLSDNNEIINLPEWERIAFWDGFCKY